MFSNFHLFPLSRESRTFSDFICFLLYNYFYCCCPGSNSKLRASSMKGTHSFYPQPHPWCRFFWCVSGGEGHTAVFMIALLRDHSCLGLGNHVWCWNWIRLSVYNVSALPTAVLSLWDFCCFWYWLSVRSPVNIWMDE